jgi:AcrR family transcriptional regulator
MARTGRRPGANTTRSAILQAARRRFAETGYNATSLRSVAADVRVDPAVVLHFFDSKDGLFQAAVGWPFDPETAAADIFGPGPETIGARIARVFINFWEDPATGAALLTLLRSAMTHEASAAQLREFVIHQMFAQVVRVVGGPDAELRVNLAAAHLIGVAVLRYALHIEPIASATPDELVDTLTPALSHYLEP